MKVFVLVAGSHILVQRVRTVENFVRSTSPRGVQYRFLRAHDAFEATAYANVHAFGESVLGIFLSGTLNQFVPTKEPFRKIDLRGGIERLMEHVSVIASFLEEAPVPVPPWTSVHVVLSLQAPLLRGLSSRTVSTRFLGAE